MINEFNKVESLTDQWFDLLMKFAEQKNYIICCKDIQTLIPLESIYVNEKQFNEVINKLIENKVQIEDVDFDLLGDIKFNYSYDESIFKSYENFKNPRLIAIRKNMKNVAPNLDRYNYVYLVYLIKAYFNGYIIDGLLSKEKFSREEISKLYKNSEFDNRTDEELSDVLYIENKYKPVYSTKESETKEFPQNIKDQISDFFDTHDITIKNIIEIAATLKLFPSEVAFFANQIEEQKIINEIEDTYRLIEETKEELKKINTDKQLMEVEQITIDVQPEEKEVDESLSYILDMILFKKKRDRTFIINELNEIILRVTVQELSGCLTQSVLTAITPFIQEKKILYYAEKRFLDFNSWEKRIFCIIKELIFKRNLTSQYTTIFDLFFYERPSDTYSRLSDLFNINDEHIYDRPYLAKYSRLSDLFNINDERTINSLKLQLCNFGLFINLNNEQKTTLRHLYANYWNQTVRIILSDIKQAISRYQNHNLLKTTTLERRKNYTRKQPYSLYPCDLITKLNSINRPKLHSFEDGASKTIKDFWNDFIEPRLPQNIDVVIKWHNVLKEYVKKPDAVLGFRTGNVAGKLRRGWETITNDGYSFFYTDNGFPHFFYKLAYDGDYIPNLEEFYQAMKNKQFPVRDAFYMDSGEKQKAAFNVSGKNPGIGTSGYKLAHVIDAGQDYCVNGEIIGIAEICKRYFNLGQETDWTIDENTGLYCRKNFNIQDKDKKNARQLAEISFLRMVHPMNYFLTPKKKNTTNSNGEKITKIYNEYSINGITKNDIAEEPLLISYVRQKFHERYTVNGVDYFQEFLDLVYPKEDNLIEDGNTIINIVYSASGLNQGTDLDNKSTLIKELIELANSNPTYSKKIKELINYKHKQNNYCPEKKVPINIQNPINENITDIETVNIKGHIFELRKNPLKGDSKMQDHIYRTMEELLRNKLIPESELNLLLDLDYSKSTFGISFPLLSTKRSPDSSGQVRYKAQNFSGYYVCTEWAKSKAPLLEEKFSQWLLHLEEITQ